MLCLECGTHWPSSASAARALSASGQTPTALHNNCSASMPASCASPAPADTNYEGLDVRPDHPTMAAAARQPSATHGRCPLQDSAIERCSIPTFEFRSADCGGFPRFGTGQGLPHRIRRGSATLRRAVMAIAATIRTWWRVPAVMLTTEVMAAFGSAVLRQDRRRGRPGRRAAGAGLVSRSRRKTAPRPRPISPRRHCCGAISAIPSSMPV